MDQTQVNRLLLQLVRVGEEHGVRFPKEFGLFLKQLLYFDRCAKANRKNFCARQYSVCVIDVVMDSRTILNAFASHCGCCTCAGTRCVLFTLRPVMNLTS